MRNQLQTKLDELRFAIITARDAIARETAQLNALCIERAALVCPHKVGEVVTIPEDGIHRHKGKLMQIERIDVTHPMFNPNVIFAYVCHGRILRKDNSLSAATGYFGMSEQRYERELRLQHEET